MIHPICLSNDHSSMDGGIHMPSKIKSSSIPDKLIFEDDGRFPNSRFPVLIYKSVIKDSGPECASWMEKTFAVNNWTNSWRNGIYSYHHYHSITHEVLGVYSGNATIYLGGPHGIKLKMEAGDVLVVPAGVGHKNIKSHGLGVVGAYPNGRSWDLKFGDPDERPQADVHIADVPFPDMDPIFGKNGPLVEIWRSKI